MISIDFNDNETILGTVTWDGKEVKIETDNKNVKTELEKGYKLADKTYTLKDGEIFLKNLPMAYQGSRFRAQLVEDEPKA
jgi:hypothetical protein